MALVKVVKNKAYFKRFQVKFRRRREGKTDYYARHRLIWQDKNKYNTPKYRLVARFTSTDVVAQVIYARIDGDKVLCSAYSHELPRYGLKVGLTNYAASYCTGLLLARRLLSRLKLDSHFQGKVDVEKDDDEIEEAEGGRNPFTCHLDVGLKRTVRGSNLFGVLKGAVDGGLNVPHKNKRFPGYVPGEEGDEGEYDAAAHTSRILGQHVADYMRKVEEMGDSELYKARFGIYQKEGIQADHLEDLYRSVHKAIRNDPLPQGEKEGKGKKETKVYKDRKRWNRAKTSLKQKRDRIKQLKEQFRKETKMMVDEDDE